MKKVELLAPAGNYDSLIGALNAGADAVYLGGEKFGARAFAENFTTQQLIDGIHYAHVLGKKIFLTVNTLVKEKEFDEIYDYLSPFYEAGLDAVIVQDLGVFEFVKTHFPGMELHVSTQMTVTGPCGAKMLAEMGAHRIVPARELSLEEIINIKKESGLDIETFVHGAMCYCYSGQCLFSSYLGGRSGNRGKCAQPCRLPYEIEAEGSKVLDVCYPLSLKDMCTIEHLPKLIEAGIDSFKIEGRMKKPEYVAGVTAIYRKYIDKYYKDPSNYKVSSKDLTSLKTLYIRSEILDGYYFRHNGREMITLDSPSYLGSEEPLLESIRTTYLANPIKCPVQIEARFLLDQKASIKVIYNEKEVVVYGQEVTSAIKAPISRENIEKGLLALGDSFFQCDDFTLLMDDNIFYSLKAIKDLRREAILKLTEQFLLTRKIDNVLEKTAEVESPKLCRYDEKNVKGFRVLLANTEHAEAYLESQMDATCVIFEIDLVEEVDDFQDYLRRFKEALQAQKKPIPLILIALPYVIRLKDLTWLKKKVNQISFVDGFLVRNLESLGALQDLEYKGLIYSDAGLYAWNKASMRFWKNIDGVCLPLELSGKDQSLIWDSHHNVEKIVYGHMPMMITANCIAKTSGTCLKIKGENQNRKKRCQYFLVDRMNKKLPVYLNCMHCYNIIYNPVVLSLHQKLGMIDTISLRLQFTMESKQECVAILDYFQKSCSINQEQYLDLPYTEFTTGHEKKGAL